MSYFMNSTRKKATACIASCLCEFTTKNARNLVVAKNTSLEFYACPSVKDTELSLIDEVTLYANVMTIASLRLPDESTDCLAVVTKRAKLLLLRYVGNSPVMEKSSHKGSNFTVIASGSLQDRISRTTENGYHISYNARHNLLAVVFYDGVLKVADLSNVRQHNKHEGHCKLLFESIRMEFPVLGMAFIDHAGDPKPTLLTLTRKSQQQVVSSLRLFEMSLPLEGQLLGIGENNGVREVLLDAFYMMLIPVEEPLGGCLLLGEKSAVYWNQSELINISLTVKVGVLLAWTRISPDLYLVSDSNGDLFSLHLTVQRDAVTRLSFQRVATVSQAISLTYMPGQLLFLGSLLGDSEVFRVEEGATVFRSLFQVENHGPIIDMALLPRGAFSQSSLVTLSGGYQDASLRVLQNGVGVVEKLQIMGDQWKSLWCVRLNHETYEDAVVINEVGGTIVGSFVSEEEMQPMQLLGLCTQHETRYCTMLIPGAVLLQAATDGLYFVASPKIAPPEGRLLARWCPPNCGEVSHCTSFGMQLVVASVAMLYHLNVTTVGTGEDLKIHVHVLAETRVEADVACMDMTPFDSNVQRPPQSDLQEEDDAVYSQPLTESKLLAVCLWNCSDVLLLALPSLQEVRRQSLGVSWLARSVLLCELVPGLVLVMVGMSHGQLLYCHMEPSTGSLGEWRSCALGDAPLKLTSWLDEAQRGSQSPSVRRRRVFVSGQSPCLIYAHHNRFTLTPVNTPSTDHMSVFHGQNFHKDCLALLRDNTILMVELQDIQRTHLRKVCLHEAGRRLAVSEASRLLVVGAARMENLVSDTPGHQEDSMDTGNSTEDTVKYRPLTPNSVSLLTSPSIARTYAPPLPLETKPLNPQEPKSCLFSRQVSSLLVYDAEELNLLHVHTLSHSMRMYELIFALVMTTSHELMGFSQWLARHVASYKSGGSFTSEFGGNIAEVVAEVEALQRDAAVAATGTGDAPACDGDTEQSTSNVIPPCTVLLVGTCTMALKTGYNCGRIHVLLWCAHAKKPHFEVLTVTDIEGVPYCMALYSGRLLVCVNHTLRLFHFTEDKLVSESNFEPGVSLASSVQVHGNTILLADMPRSILVCSHISTPTSSSSEAITLRVTAEHHRPRFITSFFILDANHFLVCDAERNLVGLARSPPVKVGDKDESRAGPSAVTGEEEDSSHFSEMVAILKEEALFHLGEAVNVIRRGSMSATKTEETGPSGLVVDSLMYGTVSGLVGCLLRLVSDEIFLFLHQVEERLLRLLPPPLMLLPSPSAAAEIVASNTSRHIQDFLEWREFHGYRLNVPCTNVVDGDVVARYLELTQEEKANVVAGLQLPNFLRNIATLGSGDAGTTTSAGFSERDISVDELSVLLEKLCRSH